MENQQAKIMIFVDSNYWVDLFDKTTPEHESVKRHFHTIYPNFNIIVNVVVVMEVMHYLVKRLDPEIAQEKWELFSAIPFEIGNFFHNEINDAFKMLKTYSFTGVGGRDATILAYMKKKGIKAIATHDEDFMRVDFVKIIDPISS